MPEVLRIKGFRFFFYSRGELGEPIHIHVAKGDAIGKIWLEPEFRVDYLEDFTNAEKRDILKISEAHIELFKKKWHEHFNQ